MKLYFQNSKGEERLLSKVDSYNSAMGKVNEFLDEHNYKSYYCRIFQEGDNAFKKADETKVRYVFDVGSHSEFFILEIETIEELKEINKELHI